MATDATAKARVTLAKMNRDVQDWAVQLHESDRSFRTGGLAKDDCVQAFCKLFSRMAHHASQTYVEPTRSLFVYQVGSEVKRLELEELETERRKRRA